MKAQECNPTQHKGWSQPASKSAESKGLTRPRKETVIDCCSPMLGSKSGRGNKMANKSFQSSEMGGNESQWGDPEFSKDFNSAYAKVRRWILRITACWKDLPRAGKQHLAELRRDQEDGINGKDTILFWQKEHDHEAFKTRMMQFEEQKRIKIMQAMEAKKDMEVDGCTFKP